MKGRPGTGCALILLCLVCVGWGGNASADKLSASAPETETAPFSGASDISTVVQPAGSQQHVAVRSALAVGASLRRGTHLWSAQESA
jgi:hypothetical protein